MSYPKLSIVVPTYNRENYLKECLDSIINQNYPNLEIVITDDNSTDGTEEFCKDYIKSYPFIKYVKNIKYPQGPNGNKNNGLDYCSGEIIGIFDDDDTMVDGALKLMVEKLLEGYDVVMGNCKIVSNRRDNGEFAGLGLNEDCEVDWKDYMCGKISGEYWSIFKKEILGNKRFDANLYGGESLLWWELQKNKKIYYINKAVRNYRVGHSSVIRDMVSNRAILNYEKTIALFGSEMKMYCPCWLSNIYMYASYHAKMTFKYKKTFRYIFKSILLCSKNSKAYIVFLVALLPIGVIKKLKSLKDKYEYIKK